jgi:transposase-like protein
MGKHPMSTTGAGGAKEPIVGAWESKPRFREGWKQRIAEQEENGLSIRAYCKQQGLGEHSFYQWRKRLRTEGPVSFALVEERKAARAEKEPRMLELALNGGER